jgi:hypothetical protein
MDRSRSRRSLLATLNAIFTRKCGAYELFEFVGLVVIPSTIIINIDIIRNIITLRILRIMSIFVTYHHSRFFILRLISVSGILVPQQGPLAAMMCCHRTIE